jgi:hypothetical protein
VLAELLLSESREPGRDDLQFSTAMQCVSGLSPEQMRLLLAHAETQRVLRRTLAVLKSRLPGPQWSAVTDLLNSKLAAEHQRVEHALCQLQEIVGSFEERGLPVVVMKTLDHWPDTGSDLDLLVTARESEVHRIFKDYFRGIQLSPSWGDRLAHKLNFRLPKLKELVEVHIGCLGQTGEHKSLAANVLVRRMRRSYRAYAIPVPACEDQIVIAALQRMYRHYYIRLTDIVNIYGLLRGGHVDFGRLQSISEDASIWPGVATLITIVCQHGAQFGAQAIALPAQVLAAARFNADRTFHDRKFVRVPLIPEAGGLFLRQLAGSCRRHAFGAAARLSLLPVLATSAYLSFKLTGNDKGVW